MGNQQAKFCQDRNGVRWVLLEGVITRKTAEDDPAGGKNLPVGRVTAVEKTSVKRVSRSPLAWPAVYFACVLLAVSAWVLSMEVTALAAAPTLLMGAWFLVWGLRRIRGTEETIDAFQLITSGPRHSDWLIVGSHEEVQGFVQGIQSDMGESAAKSAPAK